MQVEPGEFLVIHNNFPTHEKTFTSKGDMTMFIPEVNCSIKLPSSDAGGVSIKFKVGLRRLNTNKATH